MLPAKTIKKLRRSLYLEIREFADKIGITYGALLNYEAGRRTPRLPIARKIKAIADEHDIKINMDDLVK